MLLALVAAAAVSALALDLSPSQLLPGPGGVDLVRAFAARAFTPALVWESDLVPPDAGPLLVSVAAAALRTVLFALGGMSLALAIAVPLGLLSSASFWSQRPSGPAAVVALGLARAVIAGLRSVHELLWAVVFLAAFGLTPLSAVVALALPYGGTLAKIFAEMLDEAPRDAGEALRALGAAPAQVLALGIAPRALADMGAYTFYRFECALRSSAVLGFFGFETLGYGLRQAFYNLQYGELWTHLWALILLVVAIERWSGALRRRFVA